MNELIGDHLPNHTCLANVEWNGYKCNSTNLGIIEFEAISSDR